MNPNQLIWRYMGLLDNLRGKDTNTFEVKKDDEFLSIGEVCKMLHISDETLRRWEKAGKIKPYFLTPSNMDEARTRPEDYRGKRYKFSDVKELLTR